ncbi:MAG TPA: alkaline phosphatase family protein [Thermoanaerobaculia bacterium]|jgi:predicted AlkP superfamily phosphohydrolase/phosphomutase/Tfp pilus assembly protein PilF
MPRSARILLTLAGLTLVGYLLVSLYLPSSRWLVFGVDKHSGAVRIVESHITLLPPNQFYRLKFEKREGFAQRDGMIRITSKEGVPVSVYYRLRFGIAGNRLPDAQRIVNDGWNAWIRARVSEAVAAVAAQVPIEDLLSPTSQFNTQGRDPLRRTVAGHLARSGLNVTAFEIARIDADREALLRVKRTELRRDARSAPGRVAIIALDGADWELISELADDGRLPNLKALAQGGTTASVQSIQPMVSPMLWTTVATGLTPDRHGVLDYIDHSLHLPVSAYSRRAPALWEIADSFGRNALVANWWTDWPPSPHDNVIVDAPVEQRPDVLYPDAIRQRADSLDVPVETVGYPQIRRFLNISLAEYDKAVNSDNAADPINVFRRVLAKTWSDHRVAINLYNDARRNGREPLLVMMSYEGTDAVNHLFAPFHPPYREGISTDNYRKFWPAVANYYSEVDRLVGEWMGVLAPDTNVVIVSAHGFRWGKNRPRSMPNGGTMLSDHRSTGIFIAYGQRVQPSRGNHPMSIFDVAPTALALLGLPKSTEMPGNLVPWAFRDVAPLTSVRVVSYSEFVNSKPAPAPASVDSKQFEADLRAIGHLYDPSKNLQPLLDEDEPQKAATPLPPEQWGAYAYYNNLGVQLRQQGKLMPAIDAFDRAIDINPERPTPYLNKAMAMFDKQYYTDADETFLTAVAKGLPNAEQWIIDFAALYRERNMPSRAIALLYKARQMFPQSYAIAANLGSALVAASRYTEGVPELERALGMQPSSTMVLNNLGIFYSKKHDFARALDYWNRSLSIEPRQPQIRAAAEAARTML